MLDGFRFPITMSPGNAREWIDLPALERDGWLPVPDAFPESELSALVRELETARPAQGSLRRGGGIYAMRNVLENVGAARDLVRSPRMRALVEPVLGPGAFPVKATLLDKRPGANWYVGWHQDLTIAVRDRRETDGFMAWSVKAGVPHVQPPAPVLEGMLAVRVHLDPCGEGEDNGALRVAPGSHRHGRLTSEEIGAWLKRPAVTCPSPAGGALLMRPLLLHGSAPAREPARRRVLHVEFAAAPLPGGLEWNDPLAAAAG